MKLLAALLLVSGYVLAQTFSGMSGSGFSSSPTAWAPLKIGGGGYITGIDMSPDGATRVVRTDTYGGFVLDGNVWRQLVTSASMPVAHRIPGNGFGIYELRVAPSNSNRLYMVWQGYVFRSDNKGATWTETAFAQVDPETSANANDAPRLAGEKMAVDPQNADVVLVGTTEDGLWRTEDGRGSRSRPSRSTPDRRAGSGPSLGSGDPRR